MNSPIRPGSRVAARHPSRRGRPLPAPRGTCRPDPVAETGQVVDDALRAGLRLRVVRVGAAPYRVLAGVEHVPGGRAHRGGGVHVGERRPLLGEPVQVRRVDLGVAQGAGVVVGHVVGDEQQHVRAVGRRPPPVDGGRRRQPGASGADRSGLRGQEGVDRRDAGGVFRREVRGVDRRLLARVGDEVEQATVVVALESLVEGVACRRSRIPAGFVVDEQGIAVERRSALEHRQQALAVQVEAGREAGASRFDQGRKHVADVDQGLVHLTAGDRPRPPGEVRHVAAGLKRPPLAAGDFAAVARGSDPRRSAVVADEQEQSVALQPVLDQLRPHPADQVVHVGDHRREPLLVRLRVRIVRRRDERVVRQRHRVVDEERLAGRGIRRCLLVDRLEHEVVRQIGPEDVLAPSLLLVVRHQVGPQ